MSRINDVERTLSRYDLQIHGRVAHDPALPNAYIALLASSPNSASEQKVLQSKINQAQSELQSVGLAVSLWFKSFSDESFSRSFQYALAERFIELKDRVLEWSQKERYFVKITDGVDLGPEARKEIITFIGKFFDLYGKPSPDIIFEVDEKLPTRFETLSVIRLIAPANAKEIRHHLIQRGFNHLGEVWLNHQLDGLRRAGLVTRLRNDTYALTLEALHRLGTTKDRESPDLRFLLALARRAR